MFLNKDSFSNWRVFKQTKLLIMQHGLKTLRSNVNTHESFNCVWLPFSLYTSKTNLIVHSLPAINSRGKLAMNSSSYLFWSSVVSHSTKRQCSHLKMAQQATQLCKVRPCAKQFYVVWPFLFWVCTTAQQFIDEIITHYHSLTLQRQGQSLLFSCYDLLDKSRNYSTIYVGMVTHSLTTFRLFAFLIAYTASS